MDSPNEIMEIAVYDVKVEPKREGYHPITLLTSRGDVECRYYEVKNAQKAAIWVGGVGGGWDTPANGLYPHLCEELAKQAIASIRVRYRYSTRLEEAILDVLAGLGFLENQGIESFALIGHSFGGAVVIQAAAISPNVHSVITLASQSYGAGVAFELAPRCSLLLLHGMDDEILKPLCSRQIYQIAKEPKHLILYPGAHHSLNEVAEEVREVTQNWIIKTLNKVDSFN